MPLLLFFVNLEILHLDIFCSDRGEFIYSAHPQFRTVWSNTCNPKEKAKYELFMRA